jgi:uncharacterized protein (DUF305 family)
MKTKILLSTLILSSILLASCSDNKADQVVQTEKPNPPVAMGHSTDTTAGESEHIDITSEEQFLILMIPHHEEAVETAGIIVQKSQNTKLKTLAESIVSSQKKEITTMEQWLKQWFPNSTMTMVPHTMMRDLSTLSGHDLDDVFMEDMIKHHESAVHMATELLEVTQRPELVTLAK